jgi:methyl-accepting chemotaxis protein
MSLSVLLPAGVLLFSGYFLNYCHGLRVHHVHRRQAGLVDVKILQRLLEMIPQHRGMANALLQGDTGFREKRLALAQKIDADMAQLANLVKDNDAWAINDRVRQVLGQWQDIQKRLDAFDAAQSFEAHTVLVLWIQYLIQDVAEASGWLATGTNSMQQRLAHVAMSVMPLLTEVLGQARGLGTGVATKGRCGVDMRVKLRYLLQKAREKNGELTQMLQASGQLNAAGLLESFHRSEEAQGKFLACLDERIIHASSIDISSQEYFEAGTQAIQQSFALLEAMTQLLQQDLLRDRQQIQGKTPFVWAGSAVLIVASIGLVYFSA